ncbi:RAMP superfamily CRISPR-associated protein [Thermodesulfobacteriota bacterium B35]
MKILRYRIRFLTPAFLGDADQGGQWRTPPFKAQFRHWWRVAHTAGNGFRVDTTAMRRREGMLFGNAWLDEGSCQSLVQVRLSGWDPGKLTSWKGKEGASIFHPEVKQTNYKVGPQAYLGYGPLDGRGGTRLAQKVKAAIAPDEKAVLSLRFPDEYANEINNVLYLMHCFGAVGGRSRNGWGAFSLAPEDGSPQLAADMNRFFLPWRQALARDWPHGLGRDETGPLVWHTEPRADWKDVMRDLAIIKVGLRTQFVFSTGNTHLPEKRHWLSYPVTKHTVYSWKDDTSGRLPNTIRFTVRPAPGNRLRGVIFHVPCSPPQEFSADQNGLERIYGRVHQLLDELTRPVRERRYEMITDKDDRRNKLRPQLDEITIQRAEGGNV